MPKLLALAAICAMLVVPSRSDAQVILRVEDDARLMLSNGNTLEVPAGTLVEQLDTLADGPRKVRMNARVTGLLPAGVNVTSITLGRGARFFAGPNMFGLSAPEPYPISDPDGPAPWKRAFEEWLRLNPGEAEKLRPILQRFELELSQLDLGNVPERD